MSDSDCQYYIQVEGALHAQLETGVLTITLDRPNQGNAFSPELVGVLDNLWQRIHADTGVRVVVLQGNVEGFSVGINENDFVDNTQGSEILCQLRSWQRRLRLLPQVVIAKVHAYCYGQALVLLAACDIVVCEETTQFLLRDDGPALDRDSAAVQSLLRVMSPRALQWHCLSQVAFTGAQAEHYGVVTRAVKAEDLETVVSTLGRKLADKEALALRFTKETLLYAPEMTWDAALSFTAAKLAELTLLQSGKASSRANAIQSFLAGASKPGLGG